MIREWECQCQYRYGNYCGRVKFVALTRIVDDRTVIGGYGYIASDEGAGVVAGLGGVSMTTRVQEPTAGSLDQSGTHPAREKELAIA